MSRSSGLIRQAVVASFGFFAVTLFFVVAFAAFAAVAAVLRCSDVCAPNFFVNRSTRPSVSINFWRPVKKGWQAAQISRCSSGLVDRVLNVLPHAQRASTSWYFGWMPSFTANSLSLDGNPDYSAYVFPEAMAARKSAFVLALPIFER